MANRHIELHPIRLDEPQSSNRDILAICEGTKQLYKYVGFNPPWIGYLAKRGEQIVGTCAFKSSPRNGRVEIAYFTLPGFERQGVATEMARQLVRFANEADGSVQVFAQTSVMMDASTRVLEKIGFRSVGKVMHPDDGPVWEWIIGTDAQAFAPMQERAN